MDLIVIVVSYNHEVKDSPVLDAYLSTSLIRENLIVVDNSTQESIRCKNKHYCKDNKLTYLDMNGNYGLSKAYNTALKVTKYQNNNSWYIIFDQDTIINKEYFDKVRQSIIESPMINIHLPRVYSENGVFSPLRIEGKKIVREELSPNIYTNLLAINSGIVVKSDVYREIGLYDEDLFLDLVDYHFFKQCHKLNSDFNFKVFDYSVQQKFSGEIFENFKGDLARFKIYKKDYRIYCKKNNINLIYRSVTLFKRAINLTIKYHKLEFIKVLLLE